ncbi:hypothetical protein MJO28_012718 [Puccinia striiformis f. sp. tritici]|uniref:Uncharacterized protein n=1 Tax=Puccinia striiformis f. sp. tritici TaxID=168172 RepID=A0ACC0E224_9BASI|nr:hypothetical protein MJO28_012718 [Puccinia striiformis f. sp. tritici]
MARSPLPRHHPTPPATKNRSPASHRPPEKSKIRKNHALRSKRNIKKTSLSHPLSVSSTGLSVKQKPIKNIPFVFSFRTPVPSLSDSDNHQLRSYRFNHFQVLINTMNPNEIDQFLRLNGGENKFQESFLGPSQPAIKQGDSCRLFFEPTAPPHPVLSQLAYHDP